MNVVTDESVSSIQTFELDQKVQSCNFPPQLTDQMHRCRRRSPSRQEIVHNQYSFSGLNRIPMDRQHVGAVLQIIFHLKNVSWEFPGLSYGHEAGAKASGQGTAQDEASGFNPNDLCDALSLIALRQFVGDGAKRLRVLEESGDVIEKNAGFRKVGDFSNEGFVAHGGHWIGTFS